MVFSPGKRAGRGMKMSSMQEQKNLCRGRKMASSALPDPAGGAETVHITTIVAKVPLQNGNKSGFGAVKKVFSP